MPKKNSILNDLVLAPWWVSIILAGVIYFVGGILSGITSSSLGITIVVNTAKGFAPLISILLLFIALFSFLRGFKTRSLLKGQKSVDTLNKLSWKEFEDVTGELFRQRGYRVEEMLGGGADGGVDLRLKKGNQLTLVQCKRWKKNKVGLPIIRELLGAMTAESADKGILVTTSTYTSEARSFAQKQGIQLINGAQLTEEIDNLQNTLCSEAEIDASLEANYSSPQAESKASTPLTCPKCGNNMALRTAKREPYAGNQFWGCTTFPKCRGTRDL